MHYPKVIIIGETFRLKGGGGITLTNLFKDWPADKIGVVTDLINQTDPSSKYSYYQLGQEEIKFPFPFYLFQTYFKSGPFSFEQSNEHSYIQENTNGWFLKFKKIIRPAFDDFLNRIGLFSFFYKIKISESLKNWVLDFNPDIIYLQPFYNHLMRFGNLLYEEIGIPYAVHIMDDSVKYINRSIFMKNILQCHIDEDFKKLINYAQVRMCISEDMANEYLSRYGKPFKHFRNPIEVNRWISCHKKSLKYSSDYLNIIYTGRTYPPYFDTLIDICRIVDRFNRKNKEVNLSISSIDINPTFQKIIKEFKGVSFYPTVEFNNIPDLISQYDIFLICEDFDENAQKYLRFSISTRASEGMISGVPILIYAPEESALCRYFLRTDSGCIVGMRNLEKLEIAILKLWHDLDYRQRITENAIRTATSDSDSVVVREGFRKALSLIEEND
jgi:hypothetical protein